VSLIVLEHAHLSFGAQTIFAGANLRIGDKERIGLVGPNGAGKSTLLKVLMRRLALDQGAVHHCRDLTIGYLPQDVAELTGGTLLRSVLEAVPGRATLQARLDTTDAELAAAHDPDEQLRLAGRLGELAEALEHFETYYSEARALRILVGLGFGEDEMDRPVGELSGGWKMRAALAGLLFMQPDVLFLDEPTNHLDLPSVLWLDRFLNELRSAVVLICHDRDFLNRHVRRVLSFEPESLKSYSGDYDAYIAQREQEDEVRNRSVENRERVLRRAEKFVARFKAKATKARQAQSRARRVRRLQQELDADKPLRQRRSLSFRFPEIARTGRDVALLDGLGHRFGQRQVLSDLSAGIYAGDRIAIVGRNGAGKTTLLRILAGELEPSHGSFRLGAGVRVGYYAQHVSDQLDHHQTVVDQVRAASPIASESFVRGVCGAFLFSRDEVDKVVGVLSGGERARVQLARLLVDPGNLLLLDEPTNHLDVEAAEALAEALSSFGGTLVLVSHNTGFVNRLATHIWDLEGGRLVQYPGRLKEYLRHCEQREREEQERERAKQKRRSARSPAGNKASVKRKPSGASRQSKRRSQRAKAKPAAAGKPPAAASAPPPAAERAAEAKPAPSPPAQSDAKPRRRRRRRRKSRSEPRARQEVERLQERIDKLQAEAAELSAQLKDPALYQDRSRFDPLMRRYQEVSGKVSELRARREAAERG